MKTLIRIVKLVDGKEYWFRLEGLNKIEVVYVPAV